MNPETHSSNLCTHRVKRIYCIDHRHLICGVCSQESKCIYSNSDLIKAFCSNPCDKFADTTYSNAKRAIEQHMENVRSSDIQFYKSISTTNIMRSALNALEEVLDKLREKYESKLLDLSELWEEADGGYVLIGSEKSVINILDSFDDLLRTYKIIECRISDTDIFQKYATFEEFVIINQFKRALQLALGSALCKGSKDCSQNPLPPNILAAESPSNQNSSSRRRQVKVEESSRTPCIGLEILIYLSMIVVSVYVLITQIYKYPRLHKYEEIVSSSFNSENLLSSLDAAYCACGSNDYGLSQTFLFLIQTHEERNILSDIETRARTIDREDIHLISRVNFGKHTYFGDWSYDLDLPEGMGVILTENNAELFIGYFEKGELSGRFIKIVPGCILEFVRENGVKQMKVHCSPEYSTRAEEGIFNGSLYWDNGAIYTGEIRNLNYSNSTVSNKNEWKMHGAGEVAFYEPSTLAEFKRNIAREDSAIPHLPKSQRIVKGVWDNGKLVEFHRSDLGTPTEDVEASLPQKNVHKKKHHKKEKYHKRKRNRN